MTTLARRNSSIHKIKEYALRKITLEDEYEILHVIQEGWRGRLLLVEHKDTRNEVVLKAIHKESTSRVEFFREFHYNYYLSPHPNILNAYDVSFEADGYYFFAQEFAPFGDLTSNFSEVGLGEINTKKIALQITSGLDFMHSKNLVHRNINMDNILVFNSDFSEVKLCDFGATRKCGSLLKKKTAWLTYAPPEIMDTVQNEGYHVDVTQDVWQLGVLLFVLLTGSLPWQKADVRDPHYLEYLNWRKRRTLKTPKRFMNFTNRLLRMFKRLLDPKPDKRASVMEIHKYIQDKWLVKSPKKEDAEVDNLSVCYSTLSIHSSKVEKDRVLHVLKAHGIETTVDRIAKRKRIHEWIEMSLNDKFVLEDTTNNHHQSNPVQKTVLERRGSTKENEENTPTIREQCDRSELIGTPAQKMNLESDDEFLNSITEEGPKKVTPPLSRRQNSSRNRSKYQSSKSQYQGSPVRGGSFSPAREYLSTQNILLQNDHPQEFPAREGRRRRGALASRTQSARTRENGRVRSRSLARVYTLKRSKTDPNAFDPNNPMPLSRYSSEEDSSTISNDSLASVLPMGI